MRKSRFSAEQMVKILREADKVPVAEVAKKHGIAEQTLYAWCKKYGELGERARASQAGHVRPRTWSVKAMRVRADAGCALDPGLPDATADQRRTGDRGDARSFGAVPAVRIPPHPRPPGAPGAPDELRPGAPTLACRRTAVAQETAQEANRDRPAEGNSGKLASLDRFERDRCERLSLPDAAARSLFRLASTGRTRRGDGSRRDPAGGAGNLARNAINRPEVAPEPRSAREAGNREGGPRGLRASVRSRLRHSRQVNRRCAR